MKIKFLFVALTGAFVAVSAVALGQGIQFPVAELGNCSDQAKCKAYCDKPENSDACLAYAEKNNLMTKHEVEVAKEFVSGEINGPGGCNSKDSCEEYCNDINKIEECLDFAERENILSETELAEAKKMRQALRKGIKPPLCKNKQSCDAYCEDSAHMEECIIFAKEAGMIEGKELEDAEKMLEAIKRGATPPPCKGKEACDEYCSKPDNMETCMKFALEAGMMSEEEKEGATKILEALKKGVKTPPCKGREECDAYCNSEEHMQECIDFSVAAGMMSEEDAQMAKKTGGKGPGGCMGREECDAFCNNPNNQETCFNFARDNGMIPEKDLKQMEEGRQQMKQSLEQAPAEVIDCLNSVLGPDMVEKMKSGDFMPPRDAGDKMQVCFEKMRGPEGQMTPGCRTPEECQKFCEDNPDKCKDGQPDFQPGPGQINPGDQMMPQQAGPGGCKSPEECQKYCGENPEECKQRGPMQTGQPCEGPDCQQFQMQPGQMQPGQPCQGENCQQIQPGQQPSMQPCEGGNCPQVEGMQPGTQQYPRPMEGGEPGQMPPTGQRPPQVQTTPSGEPGGGGEMSPGDQVPLIQVPLSEPSEQQPQQPAPSETPPPPPPTEPSAPPPPESPAPAPAPEAASFLLNPDSLVASAARAFFNFLTAQVFK